ncbi:MAG: hypothetical protein VCC99_12865 [Alphaproteobacteria bacterium]
MRFVLSVLPFLLGACAQGFTVPGGQSDIERTWSQAVVVLPPSASGQEPPVGRLSSRHIRRATRIFANGPGAPVALYLHGCTGIGNYMFFDTLARAGYAVIAPDSFARSYRPLQCDPETTTGGKNLFVYDFRLAELTFALEQIGKLDWVDFDNLFLVGTSEGAVAAALFRAKVFNARVLAQWTCQGAPLVRGIDAPPATPILAIVGADDPYYASANTSQQQGDCGTFIAGRPGSRSLVLPEGAGHNIYDDPRAVGEIIGFMGEHLRRR